MIGMFSTEISKALGWALLHSLWLGSFIALALLVLLPRLQRAHQRYWLAYGGLMALFLGAALAFAYSYAPPIPSAPSENISYASPSGGPSDLGLEMTAIATPPVSTWDILANWLEGHHAGIVGLWLLGLALCMVQLLIGFRAVFILKNKGLHAISDAWTEQLNTLATRMGIVKCVQWWSSEKVHTPLAVGYLKPVILFPIGLVNQLTPQEVEAILAHELAHIARRDYLFNILQSLVEALFYFHPAVWWISSVIRNERENCCDDLAVQYTGNRLAYAKALLHIQTLNSAAKAPVLALGADGQAIPRKRTLLLYRIQRILNQPQQNTIVMEKLTAAGIFLALGGFWAVSAHSTPSNMLALALKPMEWVETAMGNTPGDAQAFIESDSIPKGKKTTKTKQTIVQQGDGKSIEMNVEDGEIKYLKIDGKEIPPSEYDRYKEITEELDEPKAPPPPPHWISTPGMPIPPPPGELSTRGQSIITKTDDEGHTIIEVTGDGDAQEVVVKDGVVFINGKKLMDADQVIIENGEGMPGFTFKNDDARMDFRRAAPAPPEFPMLEGWQMEKRMESAEAREQAMKQMERDMEQMEKEMKAAEKDLKKSMKARKKSGKAEEKRQKEMDERLRELEMRIQEARAKTQGLGGIDFEQHFYFDTEENQGRLAEAYRRVDVETRRMRAEQERAFADQREAELALRSPRDISKLMRANSEATAAAYVARQRAETPSSEAFETEMIDQLKSENKIANPKNYTIELSKETLVIDGQKQPAALRDQLLDAYKRQTGKPMGSQDKFILKNEE